VITTLTKQAVPLLRYRTRDIVALSYDTCMCGRTTPRMSKVRGRTDDMIIVRGINVFPSQIEHVLLQIEGVLPHYQLIVERAAGGLDDLEVVVEVDEKTFSDEIKEMENLKTKIKKSIESILGVLVKVKLVEPKTIERSMGKAKRVVDKRTI
jgi:phenylacetate-CoA ligase